MARKPREDFEGGLHHVWARGNGQQRIFLDAADRRIYLGMLAKVVISEGWLCLTYCLMGNHVHLLLETPEANLGKGIQLLHGRYARNFNTRHKRTGHLFQGRYGSARIERESQLLATVGYIARNPVSAGLCEQADAWEWSSHAAVVGTAGEPSWLAVDRLLGFVGANGGVGIFISRIVGKRTLLGRRVPRIERIGRVPLGPAKRGRNRFAWNGKVNGRRLTAGTYLLTFRSLNARDRVQDTSDSIRFRVRKDAGS